LFIPAGRYIITASIVATRSISVFGEGHSEFSYATRIIQNGAASDHFRIEPIAQGSSVSFENLTLTANGNGGTGGACINITKAAGACASIRIKGCTFGTPQNVAIKIQGANDIQIHDNLFDVSALHAISLGTATATDRVSDCSIIGNSFFAIASNVIQFFNVDGVIVNNNKIFPSGAKTATFIEGENTLPFQINNVVINGNTIKGVKCLTSLTDATKIAISNNTCSDIGDAASSTRSAIRLVGSCNGVSVVGNVMNGDFGATHYFYNSSSATLTGGSISGNSITNAGTTVSALNVSGTGGISGNVSKNAISNFANPCVGQKWFTTGNAITPGTITTLDSYVFTATVLGAAQGDVVTLTPASTAWPVQAGIVVTAYISAPNTVAIRYDNVTAGSIGVGAHDFGILVTR
jgi:hypothetical protein